MLIEVKGQSSKRVHMMEVQVQRYDTEMVFWLIKSDLRQWLIQSSEWLRWKWVSKLLKKKSFNAMHSYTEVKVIAILFQQNRILH